MHSFSYRGTTDIDVVFKGQERGFPGSTIGGDMTNQVSEVTISAQMSLQIQHASAKKLLEASSSCSHILPRAGCNCL